MGYSMNPSHLHYSHITLVSSSLGFFLGTRPIAAVGVCCRSTVGDSGGFLCVLLCAFSCVVDAFDLSSRFHPSCEDIECDLAFLSWSHANTKQHQVSDCSHSRFLHFRNCLVTCAVRKVLWGHFSVLYQGTHLFVSKIAPAFDFPRCLTKRCIHAL